MKVTPAAGRIAAIREEPEEKVGNIYLPDQSKEKAQRVRVVSVSIEPDPSSGRMTTFRVGDLVYVGRWAGSDVTVRDESSVETRYLILRPEEVLAIIEDDVPKEA